MILDELETVARSLAAKMIDDEILSWIPRLPYITERFTSEGSRILIA
jgi:hypothetical protein